MLVMGGALLLSAPVFNTILKVSRAPPRLPAGPLHPLVRALLGPQNRRTSLTLYLYLSLPLPHSTSTSTSLFLVLFLYLYLYLYFYLSVFLYFFFIFSLSLCLSLRFFYRRLSARGCT